MEQAPPLQSSIAVPVMPGPAQDASSSGTVAAADTVIAKIPGAGEVIAGKYVVERVIGRGGMGIVLAARHELLQQRVAIKLLLPHVVTNTEMVARFLREAQALANLRSQHVARVMDVGTLPSGAPYMVMEYLEGSDLGDRLLERGRLSVVEAVDAVLQALDAVAEAHAKGVVHRDLKPSNLFQCLESDGSPLVKVLDFGISKPMAGEGTDTSLTGTGAVMGSPMYMSPEQVRSSRAIDGRSDIWSLGVVLYELLTGKTPFPGETLGQVFAAILEDRPASMRQQRPEIPEPIEQVVMGCLQRDLEARVPDVSVLARAIAPFASPRLQPISERIEGMFLLAGSPARGSMPAFPSLSASGRSLRPVTSMRTSETLAEWGQTGPSASSSRPRGRLAVMALGLAILCGAGGWKVYSNQVGDTRGGPVSASAPERTGGTGTSATVAANSAIDTAASMPKPDAAGESAAASSARAARGEAEEKSDKKDWKPTPHENKLAKEAKEAKARAAAAAAGGQPKAVEKSDPAPERAISLGAETPE